MAYQYDPIILIEKNSLDAALLPAVSANNIEHGEHEEAEVIENQPTTPEEETQTETGSIDNT